MLCGMEAASPLHFYLFRIEQTVSVAGDLEPPSTFIYYNHILPRYKIIIGMSISR